MRIDGCLGTIVICLFAGSALLLGACHAVEKPDDPYRADRLEIVSDFSSRKPANLAILPVEGAETMEPKEMDHLRSFCYKYMINKGYAPLALNFTDRAQREMGRSETPVLKEDGWNREPFKGTFAHYCDAVLFIHIERYLESGQPSRFGIEIWGKAALFDAETMDLLYEHYTRCTLHPSDPGGGRERFVQKAIEEFGELLLGPLPPKS